MIMLRTKKLISMLLILVVTTLTLGGMSVFAEKAAEEFVPEENIHEQYVPKDTLPMGDISEFTGETISPRHLLVYLKEDGVNLRTGPGTEYTSLGLLYMPARYVFIEGYVNSKGESWLHIRNDADTLNGWSRADFFSRVP